MNIRFSLALLGIRTGDLLHERQLWVLWVSILCNPVYIAHFYMFRKYFMLYISTLEGNLIQFEKYKISH